MDILWICEWHGWIQSVFGCHKNAFPYSMWISYKSPPELTLQEQELREVQESGGQWHPPTPTVFVFFLCTKHVPSCYTGVKDLVILKHTVSLMQLMPHSLQDAVQVSSPKFTGRDMSFLRSGLRGWYPWVDSWGNWTAQTGQMGKLRLAKSHRTHSRCRWGQSSSYKSVSSGNPELGFSFFTLLS